MPNALAGPAGAHRCTSVPDLMLPFSSTFSLLICCSVWSINWSIFEGLLMRPDHADNATCEICYPCVFWMQRAVLAQTAAAQD